MAKNASETKKMKWRNCSKLNGCNKHQQNRNRILFVHNKSKVWVCVNVCKHLRYTNIELHWQFIYRSLTSTTYIFISIPHCRARSNDCVELGKCQQFCNAYTAHRTAHRDRHDSYGNLVYDQFVRNLRIY